MAFLQRAVKVAETRDTWLEGNTMEDEKNQRKVKKVGKRDLQQVVGT
jgi:hypothetical protein